MHINCHKNNNFCKFQQEILHPKNCSSTKNKTRNVHVYVQIYI